MAQTSFEFDVLLTEACRRGDARWPAEWCATEVQEGVLARVDYHGVGAFLNDAQDCLSGWPQPIVDEVRSRALAQSMWELRNQTVISSLLDRLAARHSPSLLLKGSALAYDLYPNPTLRARGDTDLLVRRANVDVARKVLRDFGFERHFLADDLPEGLRAQESWVFAAIDGSTHVLDLHWHVLNAPALYEAFEFESLWRTKRPLKRLGEAAFAPSRPMMFAHACVHRAFHECAPYFVGSRTYFGGDRLIWLYDIALLGRSMSDEEWRALADFAAAHGFAGISRNAIAAAEQRFGSFCPEPVRSQLAASGSSSYLRSGQLGRAAKDFWAIPGLRGKSRYALARLVPSREFIRAKYPDMGSRPLPLLYMRRLAELMRRRPTETASS